jgi:hypothetical protein
MQDKYDDEYDSDILFQIQTCKNGNDILKIIKNYGLDASCVYDCMINRKVVDIIDELMFIFSKNINFLYNFLDGWIDFWTLENNDKISKLHASKEVFSKFKNILIKFIRLDNSKDIKNVYVTILKKHFDINFYGEVMMG